MKLVVIVISVHFLICINSKDSLKHFIEKRKVKKFSLTVLETNNTRKWFEYKYNFEPPFSEQNITSKLLVGVIAENGYEFDCFIEQNNETEFNGYSIDIIEWLKNKLNFSVEYIKINSTEEIATKLLSQEIDIIVCHPNIKYQTNDVIELYPTFKGKYLLVYNPAKLHFTKDIFILTFAGTLWFVFFVSLVILAICLRITTTRYSMISSNYEVWTWVEITLWAIAAACQQGLSHTPCGFASCCIFFIGYLTAYLLYTGFAAAITSLLLQHDIYYKLEISNLHSQKLNLVYLNDSSFQYLQILNQKFKHVRLTNDLDVLFEKLNKDNTVGLAPDILINQFITKNFNYSTISKFLTSKLRNTNYRKGFYISTNSTLRKILNKQLLKMEESGVLFNMLQRNLIPYPMNLDLNSGYSSAGREHVGSAMLIWLGGVLFSLIFLFTERLFALYKRYHSSFGL